MASRRTSFLLPVLFWVSAAALPVSAAEPDPVADLSAELTCLTHGGAQVHFTVRNVSDHRIRISPDFHIDLSGWGPGGHRGYGVLFVFPAPGFDRIPAGEERTFVLDFGVELDGEPSVEIDSLRLVLRAEVFFSRDPSVFERLGFPGCGLLDLR
jgi:hypothetical protein